MYRTQKLVSLRLICGLSVLFSAALIGCGGNTPDVGTNPPVDAGVEVDAGTDAGTDVDAGTEPPGPISFIDVPFPTDLSPDGRLALINDFIPGALYIYDTQTGDLELKTNLSFPERNIALGISANGRIAAQYGDPVQAGLWSAESGWVELGSPYPTGCFDPNENKIIEVAGGYDISADGKVAVGLAYDECNVQAFRWSEESGAGVFTKLQTLGMAWSGAEPRTVPNNRASKVSDDGKVAAGWAENDTADRSPAIWNADGTGFMLDPNDKDAPGEILAISPDGKFVAGVWGNEGFYWSEATGTKFTGRLEDSLPGIDNVYANALALDGKLIFGVDGFRAFVWTEAGGMKSLLDIARANGVTVPDTTLLTNVLGVSTDGTMVLGTALDMAAQGYPNGKQVTFFLRLPVSAYGL